MSQEFERPLSQGSLAPPVDISGPATPIKRAVLSASPDLSVKAGSQASKSDQSKLLSPPSLLSSDMTPPPSSQIPGAPLRESRSRSSSCLASPPNIEKTLCVAYGASENLPTADEIDNADELKLRMIAKDLLGVAQEARMSALHFKLQNSLLSFTSNEAIKRAEVEHQLARREVEILQSSEYRSRQCQHEMKPIQSISNEELELSLKRNQELERVNATLDRRLRRAKKLIEQERNTSELLREENRMLKDRIRDNRRHFSRMIEHGPMSPSPQNEAHTPHRGAVPQFADNGGHRLNGTERHDPFEALLAAHRVLNQESPAVASTPDRHRHHRENASRHMRGAHSLSSLPMTPSHPRLTHDEGQTHTPGTYSSDDRRDRDSTISASDIEEAETEEDVPAAGTGTASSSVHRRSQFSNHPEGRGMASAAKSSTLLQTKLFGQVRKPGVDRPLSKNLKRKASFDGATPKRSKAEERVGLGIGTWNN
ncbi:uncharacterized protein BO95DRAFT_376534 [Aspergillus brunneoviolaceus CBS 621.78]|uniref:Uncharacterized protein n=1 Tax=Aspergillus brunneoviolaceus CBS 621.78 TaxID=1450534 RepID=A0ACD1FT15_9EURO|nr:hypothetical protein BO95DRAFT_376534 [Aspergillus brunneoviolaceus CBS 621.78]RAH40050.1 hypothetical protein BO95DRAFT_376534 [Aspergillus brunneoviolaceus CBS 621.78]